MTCATPIHSAHPVDPAVRAHIISELQAIEARHGVSVIFACESGSLGWGLRKALHLLRRSNPVLLEWLRSPIV